MNCRASHRPAADRLALLGAVAVPALLGGAGTLSALSQMRQSIILTLIPSPSSAGPRRETRLADAAP